MAEYVIHNLDDEKAYARLEILDNEEVGVTGQTPTLRIQRISDGLWADFSTNSFVAAPVTPTQVLTEVDATKAPGLYRWEFVRSDWSESDEEAYEFIYHNGGAYSLDANEWHKWIERTGPTPVEQYYYEIFVKEDGTGNPIEGCLVDIWTGIAGTDEAVRYSRDETMSTGKVVVWLDEGSYKVYLRDSDATDFNWPESLVVTSNGTKTFYGVPFSP